MRKKYSELKKCFNMENLILIQTFENQANINICVFLNSNINEYQIFSDNRQIFDNYVKKDDAIKKAYIFNKKIDFSL